MDNGSAWPLATGHPPPPPTAHLAFSREWMPLGSRGGLWAWAERRGVACGSGSGVWASWEVAGRTSCSGRPFCFCLLPAASCQLLLSALPCRVPGCTCTSIRTKDQSTSLSKHKTAAHAHATCYMLHVTRGEGHGAVGAKNYKPCAMRLANHSTYWSFGNVPLTQPLPSPASRDLCAACCLCCLPLICSTCSSVGSAQLCGTNCC
jgi:hypothetical protein